MPTFKELQQTHPDYNEERWAEYDVFYDGGDVLLDAIKAPRNFNMGGRDLLVRRRREPEASYLERKKRAWCMSLTGSLIDFFAAVTSSDPLTLQEKPELQGADQGGSPAPGPEGEPAAAPADPVTESEQFYSEFMDDVDGAGTDVNTFMKDRLIDAMKWRSGFFMVDFPRKPADANVPSRLEEDRLGLRRGYWVKLRRDQVLDWGYDERGKLVFAVVRTVQSQRVTFEDKRDKQLWQWRVCTPGHISLYELEIEKGKTPGANTIIDEAASIQTRFSQMPVVEVKLPKGLHVAGKVHPAELELLNKQNARSWAEYMAAFAVLCAFVENPDQVRETGFGEGQIKLLGSNDRAEWVEFSGAAIEKLKMACEDLYELMYRVAWQLHLAAPVKANRQDQSGEAKRRDQQPTTIICAALGDIAREAAIAGVERIAEGRGDKGKVFEASGMARFDDSAERRLAALFKSGAPKLPSPTAMKALFKAFVRSLPGMKDSPAELLAQVDAEIDEQVDSTFSTGNVPLLGPGPVLPGKGKPPVQQGGFGGAQ